ncbi:MAG: hypothetical protein GF329_19160 [Candidatus Lokiarchaeota archaeon]|nr:hypothetical protein [Candidatus Lokiarchaeota archaeon]
MSESKSGIGKGTVILLLLLTSFSIMAAMPATFYLNLGEMGENLLNSDMLEQFMEYLDRFPLFDFTGNLSDFLDDFDFPTDEPFEPDVEMPDDWEIPDFDWGDLPEDWDGEIPPFIPEELPEGFEIPEGWLPEGIDPSMYAALALLGLGLFGSEAIKTWVNSTPENRYWRLTTYDTFNNSNWVKSNDTAYFCDYTDKSPVPSDEKYLVWMNITYLRNGSGSLPIPHLWPTGEIMENLTVISPATIDWDLLTDPSESIIWNATISDAPTSGFIISLVYNATYDEIVTPNNIKSNMISQVVDGTPFDPPGTSIFRQMPTLDPLVVSDIEKVRNSVFSQGLDLYNTCLAVLEYFKTRYTWVSYINRTSQFNATSLIDLGYGTSADFASNFALYLRAMNISTRLVWGGVGYTKDTDSPTSNDMYRLSPTFYTEVWIPNATNTGGNWLQLDPSPVPKQMFGMTGPMSFEPINPRIPDDRMETYHYILSLLSNVSDYHNPLNHLNRGSDFYKLNSTLYRDGIPITQTMLGEIINYTFADKTDDKILGYNDSIGATWTDSFDSSSLVGPHKLNASFYALTNETLIVLNGPTEILLDSYNPEPIEVKRGTENNFIFYAKLNDPITNRPLSGNHLEANISSWDLIKNNLCETNQSGIALMDLSVNSSVPIGLNNMTARFNGTFMVESGYSFLPYSDRVFVSAAPSISPNHEINVLLDINISLFKDTEFFNDVIVRDNNVTLLGQVLFDNGTAINNAPVDIHWVNSSGEYIFGTFYTNSSGWYEHTIPISHLHSSSVTAWANTTLVYASDRTDDQIYSINCQNTTTIHLYEPSVGDYVVRDFDSVPIQGYLSDPYGVADLSNQEIYIIDKDTGLNISNSGDFITNANGNFSGTINVPLDASVGNYNILASFNGTWNAEGTQISIPTSASNSTDYSILVVARSLLVKNLSTTELSRNLEPKSFIPIGEDLDVYGYLIMDNGTVLTSQEVNAWEILTNGTTIHLGNDLTNGSGFYNITYSVPSDHPTGNTEIFVNYSSGDIYTSYLTNSTASEDPEFGYLCDLSINSVMPGDAFRGSTTVSVSGTLSEVYYGTILEGETLYITFDSTKVRNENYVEVSTEIDSFGNFNIDFIVSEYFRENYYIVNATPASERIHYRNTMTSNINLNASSTLSQVDVQQTPIVGELLNISGTLRYENGSAISDQVIIYPESNSSLNTTIMTDVGGNFRASLPLDSSFADSTENLIVEYAGAPFVSTTSSNTPIYIGSSPTITIDAPATAYQNLNFNIYGSVTQNDNPYYNRSVLIYVSNETHENIDSTIVSTDTNGDYSAQLSLSDTGNYTIRTNLTGIGGFSSSEVLITIQEAPTFQDFLWIIWIIIPLVIVIAVIIVGVKLMARKRKKRKKKKKKLEEEISSKGIKSNIQALCDGERYKEAIIYSYITFLNIIGIYKGKKRAPSQTIREFAMNLVKNMKLPPKNVYPFTSLYEEARFSNHEINKNKFEEAKALYNALISPIMKKATF